MVPKNFSYASFESISLDGACVGSAVYNNSDLGVNLCFFVPQYFLPPNPQRKNCASGKDPCRDKVFEICWFSDPLIRCQPFFLFQRLNLGQLFPAFSSAAPKDFAPALSARPSKKAVFGSTFSFGRLVSSFHPVRSPITSALGVSGLSNQITIETILCQFLLEI